MNEESYTITYYKESASFRLGFAGVTQTATNLFISTRIKLQATYAL
jgi:hypothetical protein